MRGEAVIFAIHRLEVFLFCSRARILAVVMLQAVLKYERSREGNVDSEGRV